MTLSLGADVIATIDLRGWQNIHIAVCFGRLNIGDRLDACVRRTSRKKSTSSSKKSLTASYMRSEKCVPPPMSIPMSIRVCLLLCLCDTLGVYSDVLSTHAQLECRCETAHGCCKRCWVDCDCGLDACMPHVSINMSHNL